jgi:type I restriction enzyme M protein
MILTENLKTLLGILGFSEKSSHLFSKTYKDGSIISVNFDSKAIVYPSCLAVHDTTTSNFDHPENYVVLECVDRLLEKGYAAKRLELEPRWQLGHDPKGGKADVVVKDNNGDEFLIIECKTPGEEFEKAWKKTKADGDQLFSYAQQIRKTQFLCLYTSDLDVSLKKVNYSTNVISLKDNEDYLKTLKESKRERYSEATDVKALYKVWKDVYDLEYEESGVFEGNVSAYDIGVKNRTVSSLGMLSFTDEQKIYNEFATILRQHNVSGRENAFDKLVNLFLAKIVDEIEHPSSLEFGWKGVASDDYYSLQDRLQRLYKDGMQKFLNEEVTYINDKQIDDAFKYVKNDPDSTKEKVMSYFRELKFYTNNDFAFIDVHNEQLFKHNSEILVLMVKLFQDVQLKTDEQNQFLGDLFEGFLDQGVKQSEGQFFTPTPIVRFIVSALPLQAIINGNDDAPKVIDYACGAGHFLNEYAAEVRSIVPKDRIHEYYKGITGIEKEYRLSKVSKVSAFMYGQDDINIIYGDALANNDSIKDGSYSVLIANPPYSVKGFLETLDSEDIEKFELAKLVPQKNFATSNAIESFFVERMSQLLKEDGVAGVILPSSLLTNGQAVYSKTREIILRDFEIISIVELGSGTFGATGTNTVVLFLKKRSDSAFSKHAKNRVDAWMNGDFSNDETFQDSGIFDDYLALQGFAKDDYLDFISGSINEKLASTPLFKEYAAVFKNKISDIQAREKQKLLIYYYVNGQKNNVLVVKAPTTDSELKKFLGYEWSKRRGNEGIKFLGSSAKGEQSLSKNKGISGIQTPMFNPSNLFDESKINTMIRDNFSGKESEVDSEYVDYYALSDLIDFKRASFDMSISLSIEQEVQIDSKYPLMPLGEACDVKIGGTPSRKNNEYFTGNNLWLSVGEMNGQVVTDTKEKITDEAVQQSNVKLIPKGTTLLSFKLSIGKTAIAGKDMYTNEAIAGLVPKKPKELLDKYLFYVFRLDLLGVNSVGKKAFGKSLNTHYLNTKVRVPVPPVEVQEQIISECEAIDKKYLATRMSIEDYNKKIEDLFARGGSKFLSHVALSDQNRFSVSIGQRVLKSDLNPKGKIPVISANVKDVFGFVEKPFFDDYSHDSIVWGIDGDWMVSFEPANQPFYPTDHCGVLRILDPGINAKFVCHCLESKGRKARFSRNIRASIDRVSGITLDLPTRKEQDEIMKKVDSYQGQIEILEKESAQLSKEIEDLISKSVLN